MSAEVISFRRPDGPKYAAFVSPIVPDDEETDVNVCFLISGDTFVKSIYLFIMLYIFGGWN